MVLNIFQGRQPRCLSLWRDSNCCSGFREAFSFVLDTFLKLLFRFLQDFHWSCLSLKSEWQHVSLGFQNSRSILTDKNAVVCMVSILPQISSSSTSFSNILGTFPSVPNTITITIIRMFHRNFKSSLSNYIFIFSLYFIFTLSYLPTPPLGQYMTQGQFFSGFSQVWI